MTPLADTEYAELDAFLTAEGRPRAIMDIAMLDGFLTALLIGPHTLLPSQWLPQVWGETADDPMVFDSQAQMERILGLVMRLYNARAGDLQEGGDLYDPLIYSREEEGRKVPVIDEWCTGFMRGVQMDAAAWDPLFQSDEDAALLMPMILYGTEAGSAQLKENEGLRARHQALADALGICVISIRDYWLPRRREAATVRRDTPKIGRNDPCPCGSGKKYKKCCGARLH